MRLSICIPTYNRAAHLANCLNSVAASKSRSKTSVQVCVSDNCSTNETESVVLSAQREMPIKYRKNASNLGVARNFLNVVKMADGEFVWMIGDDDLLLPHAIEELSALLDSNPAIDYFCVNSCHLTAQYVMSFPQPFSLANLPEKLEPFSAWRESREMGFMELIDPRISFDFLLGIFLSVFRRSKWNANVDVIDQAAVSDTRVFSNFDNSCPHLKIFARAFSQSRAYFHAKPLTACLSGTREWAPMYPLVRSVRLVEALKEYRKNGLPFLQYLACRNYALGSFLPDLAYMLIHRDRSGYNYINPAKLMFGNLLFPNAYLSAVYYVVRKLREFFARRPSGTA